LCDKGVATGGLLIQMTKNVMPDWPIFLTDPSKANMIARAGQIYNASTNKNGAISVDFDNGDKLGVKPGEFEFIDAPDWVLDIHRKYKVKGDPVYEEYPD